MKKLLFTLLFPLLAISQDKISTSEEEYNYLTQGYKLHLENGSDLKKGYVLNKVNEYIGGMDNQFNISHYYFIETESNKTKAILFIVKKEKGDKDKTKYLCLPINNNELFKKFRIDEVNLGLSMEYLLSSYSMNEFSKTVNKLQN